MYALCQAMLNEQCDVVFQAGVKGRKRACIWARVGMRALKQVMFAFAGASHS